MDFKKAMDEERTALASDRDNVYRSIGGLISAAIPMNNKLKDKTDAELEALYPNKAEAAKTVRNWLIANAASLNITLTEFQTLLEP